MQQMYVGLDVHKNFIQGCVLDEKGNEVLDRKFKNNPNDMGMFLLNVPRCAKIALESSSCWQYTFDYLQDAGYEVTLANPSRIRLIAESRKKTDRHDAMVLANLLRTDMLPTSYAAPSDIRMQRQISRHRLSLVNLRVEVKNKIHAILLRHGITSELDDIFTEKGIEWLESIDLPMCDRFELDNYIGLIRHLSKRIDDTQERIEETAADDKYARLAMTHIGISYYSALMITSEIGDIRRFDSKEKLVSFAGLNPSIYQSGDKCYTGSISKQGSKNLRWVLIECANIAVRHDKRLKSYYMRKKLAKGHKKAIVAVARKMLINIYIMLKHNIPYHALRVNKAS